MRRESTVRSASALNGHRTIRANQVEKSSMGNAISWASEVPRRRFQFSVIRLRGAHPKGYPEPALHCRRWS
jgi:hypothetical protein